MISYLILLILSNFVILSSSQTCPSSAYVYCAQYGQTCSIPDSINEGYISYGVDGKWNLIPFTNDHTDGTDIDIECDDDLGDIYLDATKYCCYIAADTGIEVSGYGGSKSENDGGWDFGAWSSSTTYGMRYGTGSRFVYRFIQGAVGWCNNDFFNDPADGSVKVCNYDDDAPSSIPDPDSSTWTACGNEGGYCTGLDTSAATWVRYGDNDHYYLRLVISSSDGQIPCNNDFFDDPLHGTHKYCYRTQALHIQQLINGSYPE